MRKCCLAALLVVCMLIGCANTSPWVAEPTRIVPTVTAASNTPTIIPGPTQTPTPAPEILVRLRPGVYATNQASALPLPTSGYDVYLIGEAHGEREAHLLTLNYLENLHDTAGLRDIVLERISPAYEREVNEYTLGFSDTLPDRNFLDADILPVGVRALNETLPEDEKIRVHLVDVDIGLPAIHVHLQALQEQLGTAAERAPIPPFAEFRHWSEEEMLALVDQLTEVAGDRDATVHELASVTSSICAYFAWNRFERGEATASEFASIREESTARNIQRLLEELEGRPVLALYGGWHAQKRQAMDIYANAQPWTQRLTEAGIPIYSVLAKGISGHAGSSTGYSQQVNRDPGQIIFADGTTLATLLDTAPGYNIVYVDLRLHSNASIRLGEELDPEIRFDQDIPAGEIYDGIILFGEVTPVRW